MSDRLSWLGDLMGRVDAIALWLVPPSLVGAFFGDALRKDVLTPRQRLAAFAVSAVLGVMMGVGLAREFSLSEYLGASLAILFATLGTDLIGLLTAFIRYLRDNPDALRDFLSGLSPWGRK